MRLPDVERQFVVTTGASDVTVCVKLAAAYVALALGLSMFTALLIRTLCTCTHEPGLGDMKL